MKRVTKFCLAIVMVVLCAIPTKAEAATNAPSRVINVVYDDSGSMYFSDGNLVDTWCQAKYSMEVFAAMLGEKDTMNVYYMSDYENGTSAKPRIVLYGKDGVSQNVSKIHDQKTVDGNTPFNSVRKAYEDIKKASADEKWLVVLTDGVFQGVDGTDGINKFFAQKSTDVNVMFLGMGQNVDTIASNPNNGVYFVKAETSKEILNNITGICTRIFNSNKLEVNVSAKTCSFDVPMSELIVFAQGANVSINGIKREDGTLIKSSTTPVEVKYSECDSTKPIRTNQPVKDLLGKIATFKDDFSVGKYTIDVTGAETIEIYYKPNIEVAVYLTDSKGNQVNNNSDISEGEYTINFGFVKTGTTEKVPNSKLLGDVKYVATIKNNDTPYDKNFSDGDKISIAEGNLSIDVTATYLDYNTVSTSLFFGIFKDKAVTFEVTTNPAYTVLSEGFDKEDYIYIETKIDGQEVTDEQWAVMDTPALQLVDAIRLFKIDITTLEKTQEKGVFRFKPTFPNGKPSSGTYVDCEYKLSYEQQFGSESWSGSMSGVIHMTDTRSWWERNWELFVKLVILGIILFILAGYLPLFKRYLPKRLKKKPGIECTPEDFSNEPMRLRGTIEKSLFSTIIPYIPQTATIKYVPPGVTGFPVVKVRAIKRRRMRITNLKVYVGKTNITFNGTAITPDVTKFESGAGLMITAMTSAWTYTCTTNSK